MHYVTKEKAADGHFMVKVAGRAVDAALLHRHPPAGGGGAGEQPRAARGDVRVRGQHLLANDGPSVCLPGAPLRQDRAGLRHVLEGQGEALHTLADPKSLHEWSSSSRLATRR